MYNYTTTTRRYYSRYNPIIVLKNGIRVNKAMYYYLLGMYKIEDLLGDE